jgi:hypothetical protein
MLSKKYILILVALIVPVIDSFPQCAMCRATIENNLSNGDIGIGAGLNFGILYLFVMPYLIIAVVGYFWYKSSRKNAKKYDQAKSSN